MYVEQTMHETKRALRLERLLNNVPCARNLLQLLDVVIVKDSGHLARNRCIYVLVCLHQEVVATPYPKLLVKLGRDDA